MWDGWDNAPPRVHSAFVDKVKTRWRSMKDRFNKDLRQESRVASGSGARIRTYKYHRVLSFLRPVLAQRTTYSTTVSPGSGVVLHPTATDPSQPSSSAAAGGPSTLTGDQGAGPSGLPLLQSSSTAPFCLGSSQQRQRASDRSLMPEFLHLSSVLHEAIKALGDRMDVSHNLLNARIQEVTKSLDQVKADLQRPAHHFFNQIEQGMLEHFTPNLQLSVMQACNAAYVQAMQQSRYFQQTVAAYPTVPSLSRLTSMPTSAAYHCTATSIPSTGGLHYSANTMTSAVGHRTATTVTTAAPAWTSSTDTMMQQDPGVAFWTGPTTMQQDPGMSLWTGPTTMQQDPGRAFWTAPTTMQQDPGMPLRTGPTTMQQDPGRAFRTATTTTQQDPGMALCTAPTTTQQDLGMAVRSTSAMDCETVQPDPDRSPATTPWHMSPPRRPPTRQTQKKTQKKTKQKTLSIPPPSPTNVSVLSVLSHPSSASQASHVSSPIPELPDPSPNFQTLLVSLPLLLPPLRRPRLARPQFFTPPVYITLPQAGAVKNNFLTLLTNKTSLICHNYVWFIVSIAAGNTHRAPRNVATHSFFGPQHISSMKRKWWKYSAVLY
ncbi:uncharacterized protein [Ranitomeya imitator]|uniref:uncharacterized protein n=1 Tax=Ranitomeya imitator TaxID=111125 RepID=UPI0037E735E2